MWPNMRNRRRVVPFGHSIYRINRHRSGPRYSKQPSQLSDKYHDRTQDHTTALSITISFINSILIASNFSIPIFNSIDYLRTYVNDNRWCHSGLVIIPSIQAIFRRPRCIWQQFIGIGFIQCCCPIDRITRAFTIYLLIAILQWQFLISFLVTIWMFDNWMCKMWEGLLPLASFVLILLIAFILKSICGARFNAYYVWCPTERQSAECHDTQAFVTHTIDRYMEQCWGFNRGICMASFIE